MARCKSYPEEHVGLKAPLVLVRRLASDFNSNREDLHVINLEESPPPPLF